MNKSDFYYEENLERQIKVLQKENRQLKEQLKLYETYLNRFFKINNKNYDGGVVLDQLKQRDEVIDEAIKYIVLKNKIDDYLDGVPCNDLLEILQRYRGDNR